jgi:DNA-binding transcriptional LysR family regulator
MAGSRPTSLVAFQRGSILESYQIFAEVASCGSMSQASSILDLDVSVISRHIAAIELALDCTLFERHRRGVRVTEAGEIVLSYINQVLTMEKQVQEDLGDLRQLRQGLVRIVATVGAIAGPLTDVVRHFSVAFPRIRVKLFQIQRDELISALHSGNAELGVGIDIDGDGLDVATSYSDHLVAAVAPGHALAHRESVTTVDLEAFAVATCPLTSDVRKVLQRAPAEGTPEVRPVLITDSPDALRAFCEDGAGVSMMCASAIRREVAAGRLIGVPLMLRRPAVVDVKFCVVQNAKPSFALTAFLAEAAKTIGRGKIKNVA